MEDWVKDALKSIDNKLEKQGERLNELNVNYVKMADDVSFHIQRTTLMEKRQELFEEQLMPIRKKYFELKGILKFIGGVFGAALGLEAIIHLIKLI